jgi:hypothetical protein
MLTSDLPERMPRSQVETNDEVQIGEIAMLDAT